MSLNIIIADDAAFVREALTQICKDAGHFVVAQARNGIEAIDFARKYQPDAIIMDMVMPEKNGIESTEEILKDNPEIKIIACSTVDQKFVVKDAIKAGCISYLEKPFTKRSVLEAISFIKKDKNQLGGRNV